MKDKIIRFALRDSIGYVSLINHMGNDLSVVNAARVSFAKGSEQYTEKDGKLVAYLMKHKHGTPFEHITFQFRVRAPLFVVHQWQRHRIGSFNEESARYVEMRPDFYIKKDPWESARRAGVEADWRTYQAMLLAGCPKEDARSVLPTSLYKEFWWTVNARALMNFLMLRNEEHAQYEIRCYAEAIEDIFTQVAPQTAFSFKQNGRVCP